MPTSSNTSTSPPEAVPQADRHQENTAQNSGITNSDDPGESKEERRGTLRVLLVDDQTIVREGLALFINAQQDMQVVAHAVSGNDAVRQAQNVSADIVVINVSMPHVDGPSATRHIKECFPNIKVVALSIYEDAASVRKMLEAGASGYVLKRSSAADFIQALRAVAQGAAYLDPWLTARMIHRLVKDGSGEWLPDAVAESNTGSGDLSERESDVLRRAAQGYSSKEIAEHLGVMLKTVDTYKRRAMEKLGLNSRVDIVRYAAQQGWFGE